MNISPCEHKSGQMLQAVRQSLTFLRAVSCFGQFFIVCTGLVFVDIRIWQVVYHNGFLPWAGALPGFYERKVTLGNTQLRTFQIVESV